MTAVEETPELHADLPDLLRLITELATVPTMGRRGRQILFALANAAHDVEQMTGLVIEGDVYTAAWTTEWAACKCGDNRHEWRRDAPEGRGLWHLARRDAEAEVKEAQRHHMSWYPGRPTPHLVKHLVATTTTEKVS